MKLDASPDYCGLLLLAEAMLATTGDLGSITVFEPMIDYKDGDEDNVRFEFICDYGTLSGYIWVNYQDIERLEEDHFDQESCGGTIRQLVYDALVEHGRKEESGVLVGRALGDDYYAVPPADPHNVQDKERKIFDTPEEALAHAQKLKRKASTRKPAKRKAA